MSTHSEHEIVQEPSSTHRCECPRAPKTGAQLRDNRRSAKKDAKCFEKAHHRPITQLLKLRTQNSCITGMSTKAGDELNLRHFHCLQTTVVDNNGHVNDLVQGLDGPDEPAQQGHHPRRNTANCGTFTVFSRRTRHAQERAC